MIDAALDISIKVQTQYLEDRFPDGEEKYAFAYRITIANNTAHNVQLLNRYWLITDANNKETEVAGPGVVGEQPVIEPGKHFQYTSGAILDTPVGTMQGHYEFKASDGQLFTSPIPIFSLAVPNLIN